MKDILFRGKRIDNGEWEYGSLVKYGKAGEKKPHIVPQYASDLYSIGVIPETVGQYTGLRDRNWVEIYEGDIVKHHDDILSVVTYNSAHCAYVMTDITGNRNRCQCDKLGNYSSLWIEAIGNVHDNRELLAEEAREESK